jgi:hypothetical protein
MRGSQKESAAYFLYLAMSMAMNSICNSTLVTGADDYHKEKIRVTRRWGV